MYLLKMLIFPSLLYAYQKDPKGICDFPKMDLDLLQELEMIGNQGNLTKKYENCMNRTLCVGLSNANAGKEQTLRVRIAIKNWFQAPNNMII